MLQRRLNLHVGIRELRDTLAFYRLHLKKKPRHDVRGATEEISKKNGKTPRKYGSIYNERERR